MKFSIVTVSYNQGSFLEEALRSIIEQTDVDLEYIVVEGGSSDNSRAIIERYRDRIDRIIDLPNTTATACLNRGFAVATGDIHGYLNSDDERGALGCARRAFEQRPYLDVISAHGWIIDEEGRRLQKLFSHKVEWRRCFYDQCTLVQPSTFFRATLFHKVGGFDQTSKINWDGELTMEFARHRARFGVVHDYWSMFRVHTQSLTGAAEYQRRNEDWYTRQRLKFNLPECSAMYHRYMRIERWLKQPLTLALRVADGFAHPRRVL